MTSPIPKQKFSGYPFNKIEKHSLDLFWKYCHNIYLWKFNLCFFYSNSQFDLVYHFIMNRLLPKKHLQIYF